MMMATAIPHLCCVNRPKNDLGWEFHSVPLVQWQVIPQVRVLADIRNLHIDEFDGLVGKRSEKVPKGPKRQIETCKVCLMPQGRVYILQEPLLRSDSVPVMIQLLHQ
jgi:hypothetical protein